MACKNCNNMDKKFKIIDDISIHYFNGELEMVEVPLNINTFEVKSKVVETRGVITTINEYIEYNITLKKKLLIKFNLEKITINGIDYYDFKIDIEGRNIKIEIKNN